MRDDLQMTPEAMLDLARRTAELVVERTGKLPEENAWDGEFRQILADQLMQSPPGDGRPAMEVIEQAARDILPFTTRLDHPRCFGFIPSSPTWPGVLADFMSAGYNVNACTWLVASGSSSPTRQAVSWSRTHTPSSTHSGFITMSSRIRYGGRTTRTFRIAVCN